MWWIGSGAVEMLSAAKAGKIRFFPLFAGFGLWLLTHPYQGLWHDARLYTVQAMHRLNPEAYARDPWFMFGSQDDWSIFSTLYAPLVKQWGAGKAAEVFVLGCAVLFVYAAWCLAQASLERRSALLAFLGVVSMPLAYELVFGLFQVSEPIATARGLAVPLSMMALAFHLRGRLGWGCAFHILAVLVHPLMAIGPLLVSAAQHVSDRKLLFGALIGVGAVFALAYWQVSPRFEVLSGHWADLVRNSALIVFLPSWPEYHVEQALSVYLLLLIAGRCSSAIPMRRMYLVVTLVAAAGLLLSQVCSAFFPIRLVMEAQPWRAHWLAEMFALIAAADLLVPCLRQGLRGLLAAALGLIGWFSPNMLGVAVFAALYAVSLVPQVCWRRWMAVYGKQMRWLGWALAGVVPLVVLNRLFDAGLGAPIQPYFPTVEPAATIAGFVVAGGFGLIPLAAWGSLSDRHPLALQAIVATGMVVLGAVFWDWRPPQIVGLETRFDGKGYERIFEGKIRPGETVHWARNGERVWFELGTAAYGSQVQAIGIVFSQPMATEVERQLRLGMAKSLEPWEYLSPDPLSDANLRQALWVNGMDADVPEYFFNLHRHETVSTNWYGIRLICSDPGLDWVVSPFFLPNKFVSRLHEPRMRGRTTSDFYLYDCRRIRERNEY